MRSKLRRLRGLVQRYRVDRRLPPPVLELLSRTTSLRSTDAIASAVANKQPVLGQGEVGVDPVGRLGRRRVHTAGALPSSTFELGHDVASALSAQLSRDGVDHFVVERRGDGLVFGVHLDDREAAARSVLAMAAPGWLLEWSDGARSGVAPLDAAVRHRHIRRARSWVVFRAHTFGARVIGREQGSEITFWEPGSSGLLEKVGMRGQERFDERSPRTTECVDNRAYPGVNVFPVGANFEHLADPVDVVYTWVDGADPVWLASFRSAAESAGRQLDDEALDPARFRSRDELKYSLRSVWAYCGWVRRIWIVTAGQRPDWMLDAAELDDRIRVVDHSEILPEEVLPTFNSHVIESALHRIDGLAEHFVYFNDDVFVARPIRPELFFTANGLARVFSSESRPPGIEDDETQAVDMAARRGRELLRSRFGRVVTNKPYHVPFPLRRSVCFEVEAEFAQEIDQTRANRFRSPTDISTAASFTPHYAFATGRAVFGDIATDYVNVESGRLDWHLDRVLLGDDLDTFCINETHDDGATHDEREERLSAFFDDVLPIKAPWER